MTHGATLEQIGEQLYYSEGGVNPSRVSRIKGFFKKLLINTKVQSRSGVWAKWKYHALWAFLNLMVPELALAVSLDELASARRLLKVLQEDKTWECHALFRTWNWTMGFYAVTGGFYV